MEAKISPNTTFIPGEIATAPGLKRCQKLAQKLAAERSLGSFDWSNLIAAPKEVQSRAEVQTESQTAEA